MSPLSGAVNDANDFVDFLTVHMGVPKDHIKNLRDGEATRQVITSSIAAFARDDRIENGDAIIIYVCAQLAKLDGVFLTV